MLIATLTAFVLVQTPAPAPSPGADAAPEAASAAAPTPAPAPPPAPELKRLEFLAGDWMHQETYPAAGEMPEGRGAARSKAIWILDDHHLYVTYKANTTRGTVESRGVLGYDPASRQYRLFWFDSRGAASAYSGDFDAEGNLVLTGQSAQPGARKEQLTFRRSPEGGFRMEGRVAGPDGAWTLAQESVATVFQPGGSAR